METEADFDITDDNLILFRLLGPANVNERFENTTEEEKNRSIEDGDNPLCVNYGCRMLYCKCLQNYDGETDEVISSVGSDWFILPGEEFATCDYCKQKMTSRANCLRIPAATGSWLGRYCSQSCAQNEMFTTDILRDRFIDFMSYYVQLENFGIQERLQDGGAELV